MMEWERNKVCNVALKGNQNCYSLLKILRLMTEENTMHRTWEKDSETDRNSHRILVIRVDDTAAEYSAV